MRVVCVIIISVFVLSMSKAYAGEVKEQKPVPTFAEAALILAKSSGMFDGYIAKNASLNECVAFLNGQGVYFGLMEVANGSRFMLDDCARVMGQIRLLHLGEAEFEMGKVKLPEGIDSWREFCIMNSISYVQGYEFIVEELVSSRQIGD